MAEFGEKKYIGTGSEDNKKFFASITKTLMRLKNITFTMAGTFGGVYPSIAFKRNGENSKMEVSVGDAIFLSPDQIDTSGITGSWTTVEYTVTNSELNVYLS